jgi:hypothetical protein
MDAQKQKKKVPGKGIDMGYYKKYPGFTQKTTKKCSDNRANKTHPLKLNA